jgi:hypothetical protein
MNTYTIKTWQVDGERRFQSKKARQIVGVTNRGTWNDYLISIGLPTGQHNPVLTMTDLVWVWVCKKWMQMNRRRDGVSTHETFRALRSKTDEHGNPKYTLDDFLETLDTDMMTITIELRRKIDNGN